MPLSGLMVERANELFARERIRSVAVNALAPHGFNRTLLSEIAAGLNIARTPEERATLDRWPVVLQEVIRGALHGAVTISQAAEQSTDVLPVTLAWVPAFDYNVSVWQAHSAADSAGGVTIVLSSPYPPSR